jgi:DNA-directed RNA polymerase specialized sigma24 family protein
MPIIAAPVLCDVVERPSRRTLVRLAKRGDEAACGRLWFVYAPRLARYLRAWCGNRPGRIVDEDDLTCDTFEYLFRKLRAGCYSDVCCGKGFWKLAWRIGRCMALRMRRRDGCLKRGGGVVTRLTDVELCDVAAAPPPEEDDGSAEDELYKFLWLEYNRHPLFWPLVIYRLNHTPIAEIAAGLQLTCGAVHAELRLMRDMLEEYKRSSDATRRSRVEHESIRRRKWSEEVWASGRELRQT